MTHGHMLPVCLRMLPATSSWDVGSVGYCAAVVARLHSRAPASENESKPISNSKRSRSVDFDMAGDNPDAMEGHFRSSEITQWESNETNTQAQVHAAVLRWWDVLSYGVRHKVCMPGEGNQGSSANRRLLETLGPSWNEIERLLGALPPMLPHHLGDDLPTTLEVPRPSIESPSDYSSLSTSSSTVDSMRIFRTVDPSVPASLPPLLEYQMTPPTHSVAFARGAGVAATSPPAPRTGGGPATFELGPGSALGRRRALHKNSEVNADVSAVASTSVAISGTAVASVTAGLPPSPELQVEAGNCRPTQMGSRPEG